MSGLVEFLLARIAEDEETANNWLRFEVRDGIPGNYAIPARVLAECAAKRAIVESAEFLRGAPSIHRDAMTYMDAVLAKLAGVYASHAEYLDDWETT